MKTLIRTLSFILLSNCFANCFASQDPNCINFEDPFYAEVLKASINEVYLTAGGKSLEIEKAFQQKDIRKQAKLAQEQFSTVIDIWHEPNLPDAHYQEAALWTSIHLELNEKQLLTFGLTVKTCGIPDTISFMGYCSDDLGTEASFERFRIRYEKRGVNFNFSVMDFLHSITGDSSSSFLLKMPRWPQTYAYTQKYPILYGLEKDDETYKSLCKAIEQIQREKSSFYHWMGYMEQWPEDFKVRQAGYDLDIMMIDHALDNLAIVCLKITGENETLYCSTWWELKTDEWILLNDEQVSLYFEKLARGR